MTLKPEDRALILATLGVETAEEAVGQDIFTTDEVVALLDAARSEGPVSTGGEVVDLSPESYVRRWAGEGRRNVLPIPAWEKPYQDAGVIEVAERFGYIRIGRNIGCDISLTALGEAVAASDFSALLAIHHAAPPPALPDDVIRLVIAARNVCFHDEPTTDELRELDRASEAFADRVPWEDQP